MISKQTMRTKNIHQVRHDFWKETPKAKQMLLVVLQLHQNCINYVTLTFMKKTLIETNSKVFKQNKYARTSVITTISFGAGIVYHLTLDVSEKRYLLKRH